MHLAPIIKVLYIAGWGRSGSTLLSSVLGGVPGFFSAGELAFLWQVLRQPNWMCACGLNIAACATWLGIFQKAFGGLENTPVERMRDAVQALLNKRRHGLHVLHPPHRPGPEESYALAQLSLFYRGMAEATGSRVIVDSSKVPLYASWLRDVPGVEVYYLHLVRDPRAVAFSWSREKANMSGRGSGHLPRRSTAQSALRWIGVNQIFRSFGRQHPDRYLFMRYMDFLKDPQGWMDRILSFVGEASAPNPVSASHHVNLPTPHLAFGNPGRFRHGEAVLTPRLEWRTEMPKRDRRLVTALCAPWMLRFGYPLRTPSAP